MLKKPKIKILIFLISIIIIIGYFLVSSSIGNNKFNNLKQLLNEEQKELVKYIFFPNKSSRVQSEKELKFKKSGKEISTIKSIINLSNNKILEKYKLTDGFYAGINKFFPGSGYIDFYESNIIVLSSRGVLAFKINIEDTEENFQQIKNNINEFIGINQFKKHKWFSLKDIFIFNNKVFVSYTEEIKEDQFGFDSS